MPSMEQMELSFTMVTTSLARAGSTFLIAWGSTTRRMLCQEDRPRDRAASVCPFVHGQDARPENFSHLGRAVQRQGYHARDEPAQIHKPQIVIRGMEIAVNRPK